ncbi:4032_t:CDS:2, partial [Scutellospora calospora]
ILSYNDLQDQVRSATFLVEDDSEDIIEDSEIEEADYNLEIIERFDIENIVFLNDKMFQDGESDANRQGIYDFDPTDLVANLIEEWSYENNNNSLDKYVNSDSNAVDEEDISENLDNIENENENSESLLIAL